MTDIHALKCKNCGEALNPESAVDGIVRCAICDAVFIMPKDETSPVALSFLRQGEHDLDTGKFDEAFTAYSKASEYNPEEPEAYFGMALAEHGVRYLKDAVNDRLQPICHFVNGKKFSDSANYKKALSLATPSQAQEYERKCAEIDYIREEFENIKSSGTDYDCFICVKVTDEDGCRTTDYKHADDIYFELKGKGYKPFFSERELVGVAGADYEARILYALHSSECMLVVCSNESYLNTKWVKNEYARFLRLVNDEEKESDAVAIVYGEKPIERLPGKKGKLQGIAINSLSAMERIVSFVDNHTPEAKKRREEQARRKQDENEELRRQLAEQNELLKKIQEQMREGAKADSIPQAERELREMAIRVGVRCNVCDSALRFETSKQGVVHCKVCGADVNLQNEIENRRRNAEEQERQHTKNAKQSGEAQQPTLKQAILSEVERAKTGVNDAVDKINRAVQSSIGLTGFERDFVIAFGKLTKYKGSSPVVTVPEGVIKIGDSAFYNNKVITKIILPDSVTEIENSAFSNCTNLAEINLPQSIKSIGSRAFLSCKTLKAAVIPNGVRVIRENTFEGCESLSWLIIPDGVTEIQKSAFLSCHSLVSVILPKELVKIGVLAFSRCSNLKLIVIPERVRKIGDSAFYCCNGLEKLLLPNGLTSIGYGAFQGCHMIRTVMIPSGVKNIGTQAFSYCHNLEKVTIESGVRGIKKYAFTNCKLLQVINCYAKARHNSWSIKWNKKKKSLFGGRYKVVWGYNG